MNERRKIVLKDGKRGWLLGIFQYASEDGAEPLAVIENEDGTIYDAHFLNFKFEDWGNE